MDRAINREWTETEKENPRQPGAIDRLHDANERLHNEIARLGEQLQPILTEDHPLTEVDSIPASAIDHEISVTEGAVLRIAALRSRLVI